MVIRNRKVQKGNNGLFFVFLPTVYARKINLKQGMLIKSKIVGRKLILEPVNEPEEFSQEETKPREGA